MNSPKVSVLLSVWNGEKYLAESIESILAQTLVDFEFIIINNGSVDTSGDIIARYKDKRIQTHYLHHQSLVVALNTGWGLSKGQYIARMDADDVAYSERFARQVDFLDSHQDIGAVGTTLELINEHGVHIGEWRPPVTPKLVEWFLPFTSPLAHPSVMMRSQCLDAIGGYNTNVEHMEDYDLWWRLSRITLLANLPDILLKLRKHNESISSVYVTEQAHNAHESAGLYLSQRLNKEIKVRTIENLWGTSKLKWSETLEVILLILRLYHRSRRDRTLTVKEKQVILNCVVSHLESVARRGLRG